MMNFTGLSRVELRRMATSARIDVVLAAVDETMRREETGETDMRKGRRLMGNDDKVDKIRDRNDSMMNRLPHLHLP